MGIDLKEREAHIAAEDTAIPVDWENERGDVEYQDDGVTPIQVFITGLLSARYRRVQARQRGRLLRTMPAMPSAVAAKTNGKAAEDADLSPAAQDAEDERTGERSLTGQTEAVAACITGWTPGFTSGGEPLAYSLDHAIALLRAFPHMQRKLERVMDDHARFFAAVSTS